MFVSFDRPRVIVPSGVQQAAVHGHQRFDQLLIGRLESAYGIYHLVEAALGFFILTDVSKDATQILDRDDSVHLETGLFGHRHRFPGTFERRVVPSLFEQHERLHPKRRLH